MADDFHTTRWSLIAAARGASATEAREALDDLCRLYWFPLYAWARRGGLSAEDARDATQGFFSALLSRDDLSTVRQGAGRFRAWLLACMKHYLSNEREAQRALKRGGDVVHVAIGAEDAEALYARDRATGLAPDAAYERQWAITVLSSVRADLREEYAAREQEQLFDALSPVLVDGLKQTYRELGLAFGMSEEAVKQAVHRLRRRFLERLQARVADTVSSREDLDAELDALLEALG